MKILIAPNSYKECADSVTAASYFEKYIKENDIKGHIIIRPISDGGDGFLNVCRRSMRLQTLNFSVTSPSDDTKIDCEAGYDKIEKTVYIESADILGMKVIPPEKRHPVNLSSKGLGELLIQLISKINIEGLEVKKVVMGIGGTGTNDLALGLCSMFGLKLLDINENELDILPKNFNLAKDLIWNKAVLPFKIEVIVDVNNPLLGKKGATNVFGRQKGSTDEELKVIEDGFVNICNILEDNSICELPTFLSGAGGGLAAGLTLFLGARTKFSSNFVLDDLDVEKFGEQADIIITGEGAFDSQSLMKKGTGIIIDRFKNTSKKIFLCCGHFGDDVRSSLPDNVIPLELGRYFKSTEESIKRFEEGIKFASADIAGNIRN
jgi:glycerate kinase